MRCALSLLRPGGELSLCVATLMAVLWANQWVARALSCSPDARLESAAGSGDHNQLREALRDGASIETIGLCGWTPLMLTAQRGDREGAALCIATGADVRATGRRRYTGLHWAAARGSVPMVKLLLAHAAAIDASDECGNTPMNCACVHDNDECAAVLLAAGARRREGLDLTSPPASGRADP